MTSTNQTCGPMFHAVLEQGSKLEQAKLNPAIFFFSLGYMTGQAEKVWMGACTGFMMRPGVDELSHLVDRVRIICKVYALRWDTVKTSRGTEVWVTKPEHAGYITTLEDLVRTNQEDSETWHILRGVLCGIPAEKIDTHFHERYTAPTSGAGQE